MRNLVAGIHQFRNREFKSQRAFYERLASGQAPEVLFITCCDSRIDPNLITTTRPGEMLVLRNAGNLVPAYGASTGGEGPTIEFAVAMLQVKDIIVCGHTLCGVMKAILNPESVRELPLLSGWLTQAEATRRIVRENYTDYDTEALWNVAVQENVLVQLENLQTHPAVAARLARGDLSLHGWVYKLETGEVYVYAHNHGRFMPLAESYPDTDAGPPPVALTPIGAAH